MHKPKPPPERQTQMSTITFDEVVEQVKVVADAMGETVEQNLPDYAPSIAGQHGTSVTVKVNKGDQLWTEELEASVREHIESFTDATGARCTLTVVYVE